MAAAAARNQRLYAERHHEGPVEIHRSKDRGVTKDSWLDSRHSFSFNYWHRDDRMGFGKLRVLNEDIIASNTGFETHSHQDMEIVTIVLEGELTHVDSTGGKGVIKENEVQRMSAGTGVLHSEKNDSGKPVHLLQIWVEPRQRGIHPSYEQARFRLTKNKLVTIADGTQGREIGNALYMHQEARLSIGEFEKGMRIAYNIEGGRGAYVFVIKGQVRMSGEILKQSDAAAVRTPFALETVSEAKVLVIEVPL